MYNNSRPSLIPDQPDPGYQTLHILMGSHTPCIHGFHLSKPNFDQTSSLELMLLTMFGIDWNSHSKLQSYTFNSQQKKCSAGTQRLSSPFSSASVTIHGKTRKQFNASPPYDSVMRSSYCLPSPFWTTHVWSECHHMARCYLCDYTSSWTLYDTSPDPWKLEWCTLWPPVWWLYQIGPAYQPVQPVSLSPDTSPEPCPEKPPSHHGYHSCQASLCTHWGTTSFPNPNCLIRQFSPLKYIWSLHSPS